MLGLVFMVSGHTPGAWACSCAQISDTRAFASIQTVFTGTVIDRVDPKEGATYVSSADEILWTIDVQRVQKGQVADPVVVSSARQGASCGYVFEVGKRYQVWGGGSADRVGTNSCMGTRDLSNEPAFREYAAAADARIVAAGTPVEPPPPTPTASPNDKAYIAFIVAAAGVLLALVARRRTVPAGA